MKLGVQPHQDIKIVTASGKIATGNAIRDKREAEWLVERLWQALGLGERA